MRMKGAGKIIKLRRRRETKENQKDKEERGK